LVTCERAKYNLINIINYKFDLRLVKELNIEWRADSELNKILLINLYILIIVLIRI
jgi:hypothetical protein